MSQDKKPSFGLRSKIAAITPDATEARHGFVARESEQLVRMREPVNAATSQINVRAETADLNWCKHNDLSYRKAFKRIAAAIRNGTL